MASRSKFSYKRLKQEISLDDEEDEDIREHVVGGLRHPKLRGVQIKRRLRVRIPRLTRFLRFRKGRGLSVKIPWSKIWRRMKESQAHFGDLFAGNYLFMQINTPTPLINKFSAHGYNIHNINNGKSFVKGYDFPCPTL